MVGSLVLGSCSSTGADHAATNTQPSRPAPSTTREPSVMPGHTSWTETFVDTSRPTEPKSGPSKPSRTLVTAIYRPNGSGPFPLIMFSHGLSGHPEKFTKLLSVWANAGYVVVAPAFPLTNSHVKDAYKNLDDGRHQATDVSFVLDHVLALNRDPKHRLFGTIDTNRIGAGGLSLGGFTTYELLYGTCCRDHRIKAAEVLDGFHSSMSVDGHVPLLIAHSDTDPAIPYASAKVIYDAARGPVWFVTLHGASHASEWENDVTPYDHIAERLTTDFWNATLKGDSKAFAHLERDATVPGLATIVAKPGR
jgi:dienelactone hydrolase